MRIERPVRWACLSVSLGLVLFGTSQSGAASYSAFYDSIAPSHPTFTNSRAETPYAENGFFDHIGNPAGYISFLAPADRDCPLCPDVYVWAEGLVLARDNQAKDQPLVLDLNTNEELLSAGDLDFDVAGGLRVGFCGRVSDCWTLDLEYLGVFDQSASAGEELDDSLMLPGALGLAVNNFFFDDEVDVRYESELHSFEANLVKCCCGSEGAHRGHSIEWLAGFRFIRFDEEFSMSATDSAEGTSVYDVETENNLYGAQVGARFRRFRGWWSWEATGKAGLYANDMEQTQAPIIDFPGVVFRTRRGGDDTEVSFVGDLNFTALYQLNNVWAIRTGYNLIWLANVALAPDQLDFTNAPNSGNGLVDGGGVFLHGVSVGLEARW
jgi:hypothetical protein